MYEAAEVLKTRCNGLVPAFVTLLVVSLELTAI